MARLLIESGTHERGVSVADFKLPPNVALRYERPAAALAGLLTDYHVLDSIEGPERATDWMLPGWASIRIMPHGRPTEVTLASHLYRPVPVAALYGVTSRAMEVRTPGGVTVGIGISPTGWARLFGRSASAYRDRITPLEDLMLADRVEALVAALRASDCGPQVKPILDAFFAPLLATPHPDEPMIEAIGRLIVEKRPANLNVAAHDLGVSEQVLRRCTNRYFGFPPKTLMLRIRFLTSLMQMWANREHADYSSVSANYFDQSHFLRDAHRFLTMTPRQFMALKTPYLDTALRARACVLGAATGSLYASV